VNKPTTVETLYGPVEVSFTSRIHVHVSTSNGTRITVRGKAYYVSVHLYLTEGSWVERKPDYNTIQRDRERYPMPEAAPTIRIQIITACQAAVEDAITADPQAPARGEVYYLGFELTRAEQERSKLLDQAHELTRRIAEIRTTLLELDPTGANTPPSGASVLA
jgi:hypothetical protein